MPRHELHYVSCRFKRAREVPSASTGARASRSKRVVSGCDVTFQLLNFGDHVEYRPNGQSVTCAHAHSLDESDASKARDRLLKRWEQEVSKMARALIGSSVTEWMNREDQVICF
jgi:hypothetical protein